MAVKQSIIDNGIDRTESISRGNPMEPVNQRSIRASSATRERLSCPVRSSKTEITEKGGRTRVGLRVEARRERSQRIGTFLVIAALERARANISCTRESTCTHAQANGARSRTEWFKYISIRARTYVRNDCHTPMPPLFLLSRCTCKSAGRLYEYFPSNLISTRLECSVRITSHVSRRGTERTD